MYEAYQKQLFLLQDTGKCRLLPTVGPIQQRQLLDFSTNDYLGLSCHPQVVAASIAAAEAYGVGATGSRLVSGNHRLHLALETQIALAKKTETALIFPSGFQANISAVACLLERKLFSARPLVFFDRLNHASLYQAVFLSGAELIRYRHLDLSHLQQLLEQYRQEQRPKFIITETVFGMDGDVLPLADVAALALSHQALLYLDEAHATGIIGEDGYGLTTTVDLSAIPHVVMGTFSKALGCSGGYIACHQIIRDYLLNRAAGFIYTTASPPMLVAAASQAWELVKDFGQQRHHLAALGGYARYRLVELGWDTGTSTTHIIPLIIGDNEHTMQLQQQLSQQGILLAAIRPPTVPSGRARLRLAFNCHHQQDDIDRLIDGLAKVAQRAPTTVGTKNR